MKTDEGTLLGGRVGFIQPVQGYRAAIDPILLAAACPVDHGMRVADLGSGAGAASLALAWRCPGAKVIAIEREASLLALQERNIRANGFTGRIEPVRADIRSVGTSDIGGAVDIVMINPPYLADGRYSVSEYNGRAAANSEGDTPLTDWVAAARRLAKPKALFAMIHRADRLADILAELGASAGDIHVFPLWPRAGQIAKRVIVTARFGSRAPFCLTAGLSLHTADGSFTDEADSILRDGKRLLIV